MNRFDQRLADHSVRDTLTSLRDALEQVPDEVRAQVDESQPGTFDRAEICLDTTEGLLEAADGRLVAQSSLDALHGHADQAFSAANRLQDDPGTYGAQLDQALEAVMAAVGPLAIASAGLAGVAQKIGRRSGGLQRKLRRLEGEAEHFKAELDDLESKAGSGLEELTSEQTQRRQELLEQLETLKGAITEEQARIAGLAEAFEQKFETEAQQRGERFDGQMEELKGRGEQSIQELIAAAEASNSSAADRSGEVLAEAEGYRDKVSEIYTVVADTATTGAFRDEAAEERGLADTWRTITICFASAALAIALAAVGLTAFLDISPQLLVAKIAAGLACGAIATYAGKQSAHHRKRGDEAKDLELELVTLDGFLHDLADEEQQQLRKTYFKRAFRGRGTGTEASVEEDAAALGVTPELLAALLAIFKANQSSS